MSEFLGTVDGFLSALYRDVVGRRIDPAAQALYSQQLGGVTSPCTLPTSAAPLRTSSAAPP